MTNKKIEIEVTPEQAEKLEILNSNGISAGEAIDMLFTFKEEVINQSNDYLERKFENALKEKSQLEEKISKIDEEISTIEKLKETSFDVRQKQKALEQEYGEAEKSYEMQVQDAKRKISWAHDFFKF